VVEDLHWIDTSSEEFLNAMLDAVAGVPLLLLVTYRIGYTPPFGSRSFYTTLTLHSFSEAETLAMAGRVLGTTQFPVAHVQGVRLNHAIFASEEVIFPD
jgi:predicted ATPase